MSIIVGQVAPGTGAFAWVERVHAALVVTGERYPFLAYGTDWLAFAHLVLALVFVGRGENRYETNGCWSSG